MTGQHSIDKTSIDPQLFWVLVLAPSKEDTLSAPRFFVFTSQELVEKVSTKHVQDSKRVYILQLSEAEAMQAEGQWAKIVNWLARK